jgi:hypothetical protein
MVENMEKVHGGVFVDVFRLFGVDEVPCATEVGVGYVDGGIKV